MSLESHIHYNSLRPASTLFSSKNWVLVLCVHETASSLHIPTMITIKLNCLYFKYKDSAHGSSIMGMRAIPHTGYQGKSGKLGHR
jgi:hypothetical protein